MPERRADPVGWALTSRETGEVVLWQTPNAPSVLSLAATVVALAAPRGSRLRAVSGGAAVLASTWWGADELARGVNPARRALGAGALIVVLAAVVAAASRRRRG